MCMDEELKMMVVYEQRHLMYPHVDIIYLMFVMHSIKLGVIDIVKNRFAYVRTAAVWTESRNSCPF